MSPGVCQGLGRAGVGEEEHTYAQDLRSHRETYREIEVCTAGGDLGKFWMLQALFMCSLFSSETVA